MLDDERGKSGGMVFGSGTSGLFSTGGADPRVYVGAPVPRRIRVNSTPARDEHRRAQTPAGETTESGGAARPHSQQGYSNHKSPSPARSSTSQGHRSGFSPGPSNKVHDGMFIGAEAGEKSLLDFDVNQTYKEGKVLLDSPRSVQACLNLGVAPTDLLLMSYHDCIEKMKNSGESILDAEVCKMRYKYFTDRSKRVMKAALQERDAILSAEIEQARMQSIKNDSMNRSGANSDVEQSTMVANEERRLQKIVDTNLSRLRQQLLHRELLQRQRAKEDQRLAQQRKEDEQRKADEIVFLAERSRKEEEAQALRNEARELDRMRHAAEIELKRAKYEEKDLLVKERMRKTQVMKEAMNEAKQLRNMERRKQMKEQAEAVLEQRRTEFGKRWEKFEEDRKAYDRHLEEVARQRREEAELKEEKIEVALARSDEILHTKIQRTTDREARAEAKLKEFQTEREIQAAKVRDEENTKELLRQQAYQDAQMQQQERAARFTNRIRQAEARLRQAAEEESMRMRQRHERQREVELDKQLCVERSKKIDEARRSKIQSNIERKNSRIEADKIKRQALAARRRIHREEVERSRVHIEDSSPGPGDYLVTVGNVGTEGSKWKFGLPASVMGLRTVIRNCPPPGYIASPGPGVYKADSPFYARHRRAPSPAFGRHDRWAETSTGAITPGPADYAPKMDDPLLEDHRSQQRAHSSAGPR